MNPALLKQIPETPFYSVDEKGGLWTRLREVRQNNKAYLLTTKVFKSVTVTPDDDGYLYAKLWVKEPGQERERRKFYVHRLVLQAYVGPCPEGMECRHLDGNPRNCAVDNLAWGTKQENAADKVGHGTAPRGGMSGRTDLTPQNVEDIREMLSRKVTQTTIARVMGISPQSVNDIKMGRRWNYTDRAEAEQKEETDEVSSDLED